jgi:hypothetical protein
MNELIIEGLTESDLTNLYQLVGEMSIPIKDREKSKLVADLYEKLDQIITYFNNSSCDSL